MSTPDWRSLYPFESHHLAIDGLKYHYLDEGTGSVLLLSNGNPTWSFFWRDIVTALKGEFRLIVVDHIGCGLSDKPGSAAYPYRLKRRDHASSVGQSDGQVDRARYARDRRIGKQCRTARPGAGDVLVDGCGAAGIVDVEIQTRDFHGPSYRIEWLPF
jgi:pimeloyl-ACP methyl ester carboxylesterase